MLSCIDVWIYITELALFAFFVLVWFVDVDFRKPRVRVALRELEGPRGASLRHHVLKLLCKRHRLVRIDPDIIVGGFVEQSREGFTVTSSIEDPAGGPLGQATLRLARCRLDRAAEHSVFEALDEALARLERNRQLVVTLLR